jgi:hypothetical protein
MSKENSENPNAMSSIEVLWREGFFKDARTLRNVAERITEKWGHNFSSVEISKALKKASFVIPKGTRGSFHYIQKISSKSKKVESIEEQLFSEDLINKLGNAFKTEVSDLHINFNKSGNCTAFTLRKMLEKSIYLVFAKNSISSKLEDKSGNGRIIGLEVMIDAAAREKINGIKILQPQTAKNIKGIKFLGDVSAHNPLINVDMETILPQMPFIIAAYKELAERL